MIVMCGIAGILYLDGREPSSRLLYHMTDLMWHRGPDDVGIHTDEGIGLGFRRLAIIDLQEGRQPMCNEDGTVWVVFNGEIYNYKHLRNQLEQKGHVFRTESDTETLVHLYEEFGEDCVKRLRGMFSFAVWDGRRKELFCARDHFGIKPFYYSFDGKRLVFGSEIKSILASDGMGRSVRPESLVNYLTFQYVPDPFTMFQNIMKLPPAHCLHITMQGKMKVTPYWDPIFEPEDRPMESFIEELRWKLEDSIRHHMQSDVPLGCFLSSGIDSTSIVASMRRNGPLKTFSVGFDGPNNECLVSRQSAEHLHTDHTEHIITPQEYFRILPRAVWHQDEPVADPSAIALYFVSKLAKEQVTVVLSGEGADELFGGYRIYREPYSLRPFDFIPLGLKRLMHRLIRKLPVGMKGRNTLLRATTPLEERFFGNALLFTDDLKAEVTGWKQDSLHLYKKPFDIAAPFYEKVKHLDPVSRMQYIDLKLWLPGDILAKADKMTMAHSLELRVPFLDKEVFELAAKIPAKYRIAEGTTKFIFRKAMEGFIPPSIVHRPKLGFPVPLRHWLTTFHNSEIWEQLDAGAIGDYINKESVRQMMVKHQEGRGDYARKIWAIYVFSLWHQIFVEADGDYRKAEQRGHIQISNV